LDQLAKLEFDESKAPLTDGEGKSYFKAGHFSVKEVELVVEMEAGLKDPSKKFAKIKWINVPNSNKFVSTSPTTAKLPTDFKAQMAAARARTGATKPVAKTDEIPFRWNAQIGSSGGTIL